MCRLLLGMAITGLAVLTAGWANASDVEDNAVAHLIASNLKTSGQIKGYQIGVTCKNRVAWLSGEVASRQQRRTALVIARKTPGVVQVIDSLSVKSQDTAASSAPSKPSMMRDISSKLKATLAAGTSSGRKQRSQSTESSRAAAETSSGRGQRPQSTETSRAAARQPASSGTASGVRTVAVGDGVAPMVRRNARHISLQGQAPMAGQPVRQAQLPGNGMPYDPTQAAGAAYVPGQAGAAPMRYDNPNLPAYAWPGYAAHPNYAGLTYPKQYSPTAWPYIGPFYPYPQVPLGWRRVSLEWDDGWWWLDFNN